MSTLPAPALQKDRFVQLQAAIDHMTQLGDVNDPSTHAEPDPSAPYGCGPNDEYLGFGVTWWRYMTSGAVYYVSDLTRPALLAHAAPSMSLGACIHGMARILLHLSQLDDIEFTKTIGGMMRARRLAVTAAHAPHIDRSLNDFTVMPWPSTHRPQPEGPETLDACGRRAIASVNFSLGPHAEFVPLISVDHEYLLRLCQIQGAIDNLRAHTEPYRTKWDPTAFNAATDIGPAWATFYYSALAHAVGGPQGQERLDEIGTPFDGETCLAGVAHTYDQLRAMDPADRPAAFASIDCSDYYFDPAPDRSAQVHSTV